VGDKNQTKEDELEDTCTSPSKKADMETDDVNSLDSGAKRRLVLGEDSLEYIENNENYGKVPMLTYGTEITNTIEIDDDARKKRSKRGGANSTSKGSAASREESVRSEFKS
jgi:hypothetical protein